MTDNQTVKQQAPKKQFIANAFFFVLLGGETVIVLLPGMVFYTPDFLMPSVCIMNVVCIVSTSVL